MSLAGFLVKDHCQKCKLIWNVATTAGVLKLLISLACVITLIAQFWSGCFRAFPHLVLSLYIFPFADRISVENCLRWALMTGLRRFAIYSGGNFFRKLAGLMESPSNAQAPTFYFNEAVIDRQKRQVLFYPLSL